MDKEHITIGEFTISHSHDYPDGTKAVWIEQSDGEGGQFPAARFEEVIKAFYDANF